MDSGGSDLENVIDRILSSARFLKEKLESVKELSPNNGIDYEQHLNSYKTNQRVKVLERENEELKQALEDHQYGLEFIMSKYRSHMKELIKLNLVEKKSTHPDTPSIKEINGKR